MASGGSSPGARSILRSEAMKYVQVNVKSEFRMPTMRAVAKMGDFHIVDLSEVPQDENAQRHQLELKRRVADAIKFEKDLAALEQLMADFDVEVPACHVVEYTNIDVLEKVARWLEPVQEHLQRNLEFKRQMEASLRALRERWFVIRECLEVHPAIDARADDSDLESGGGSGGRGGRKAPMRLRVGAEASSPQLDDDMALFGDVRLTGPASSDHSRERIHRYLHGIIPLAQQPVFERILFRVTRGNALVRFTQLDEPLEDPVTGEKTRKSVFLVACIGQAMQDKVTRITALFSATLYDIPPTREECRRELDRIMGDIRDREDTLQRTIQEVVQVLREVAYTPAQGRSPLREWQVALEKDRAMNTALRKAFFYTKMFVIEGWCPEAEIDNLRSKLQSLVQGGAVVISVDPESPLCPVGAPPTLFRTNRLTAVFQDIVNTYGVPRYREVNPALFTVVSFPFLFGVMFGDVGHGALLALASLIIILNERSLMGQYRSKRLGEAMQMMFPGRYMLFMMGLFAVYAGFIYNDMMAVPVRLFDSTWDCDKDGCKSNGSVYPFGIDPTWYHTRNELTFFNSLKMKLSVILGVVQMTFGIILSSFNHVYFGDTLALYFEFVPQLLFMLCTFGYMVFMIIYKFCVDWSAPGAGEAPNLIQTMINMFLQPGHVDPARQLYPGQGGVQLVLVLVAALCVPTMLFFKPILKHRNKHDAPASGGYHPVSSPSSAAAASDSDDEKVSGAVSRAGRSKSRKHSSSSSSSTGKDDEEAHSFADDMIHQAIHTIEFVLGAVSNTASYLRLWALSLAHAELANVFWQKLIVASFASENWLVIIIGCGAWAAATFSVLMSMDVLECFLHALRLHWVEFQSKFFAADGYAFSPFNFEEINAQYYID